MQLAEFAPVRLRRRQRATTLVRRSVHLLRPLISRVRATDAVRTSNTKQNKCFFSALIFYFISSQTGGTDALK